MTETPTVSVIIPTYNRAAYIAEAIQSVLNQTYTDCEIIVVDDGSTDNTDEVVAQFGDAVRYFKQENGGSSSARNHGLREARGQLIAFLDSDDVFLPTKLEKQVTYMREHPEVGLLHTQYVDVDDSGQVLTTYPVDQYQGQIYKLLLYGCPIITSTVMMPKRVFDKIGLFDEALPMAQDIDLWIRVAKHYSIGATPETLMHYLRHAENKPRDIAKILTYALYILDKNRAMSPDLGMIFWRRLYAYKYYFYGHHFLNQSTPDERNAWRCWTKGVMLWPFQRRGGLLGLRLLSRTVLPQPLKKQVQKWVRR